MTAILGLNAYHGDAAAALVVDGELVAAAEEERFNRVKHCAGFPALAAAWCLADAGLTADDLDHVAVSRDPKANLGRKLLRTIRHGASARYLKARLDNAARIRDVGSALTEALGVDSLRAQVHNVEHHQAHVASAFFVSPFEDAAILSVDGFGDFASTMLAEGHGNRFEVLERVLFPHSLGIFYTAVTQWLGFPHYGDEGKVMGLAPYGTPRYLAKMRELVRLDGPLFTLGLDYFTHDKEGVDMNWDAGSPTIGRIYSDRLIEMFGAAREPDGEITALHNDVAASLQAMLEEAYLHLVGTLWEQTQHPEPLPRRRGRAERGRQRPHPARDAVPGAVRPAGRGRLRHRGRRRVLRLEPGARQAARLRDGARVHGPGVLRRGDRGGARRGGPRGASGSTTTRSSRRSPSGSPTATSSAGSRGGWSSGRARSATARSSPTRAAPT